MDSIIRNISDTARWVAIYRADESARVDAVFNDRYARKLAGERGEQIVQAMVDGRQNSWSFVARTYLFDQVILQHVSDGFDLILNLASGLDTRPYRLKLPSTLTWIDVDLPEISDYMQQQMDGEKAVCHHERIAIDLADREARIATFQQVSERAKKVLVVSEGLVGYLEDAEAGSLAYDLAHCRGFEHWVLDLMSPGILPLIQQEMGDLLVEAGSPLKFAPADGEDFFRLFGWESIASYSKLQTALQLRRLPEHLQDFASIPEPTGPKGSFPWSGVCVFNKRMH